MLAKSSKPKSPVKSRFLRLFMIPVWILYAIGRHVWRKLAAGICRLSMLFSQHADYAFSRTVKLDIGLPVPAV